MEHVATCLLCGSVDLDRLIEIDPWIVRECRACGLGVLSPQPNDAELSDLYEQKYFETRAGVRCHVGDDFERLVRGQRRRVGLVRRFVHGGRLLDVGCATGYFLAAAQARGFDVHGIERSEWAVEQAVKRLGPVVTGGDVLSAEHSNDQFDVITMWHVLEHTRDPLREVTTAARLLRPGGHLFVELPNYQGYDAARYGTAWSGWDLPYHLWHFTPRSLATLLEACGLRVVAVKRHASTYVRNRLRSVPVVGLVRNLACLMFSGRDMTVVATKP